MAVRHDIYDPPDKNPDDPTVVKSDEKPDADAIYWKNKATAERAKREYEEEKLKAEKLASGVQPESPFKVTGSVNLGAFDFQKQQEELRQKMAEIQTDSDKRIAQLQQTNEHYRDQLTEIRINALQQTFQYQMEATQKMLQERLTAPQQKDLASQISEMEKLAGVLGYRKVDIDTVGMPSDIRLEMLRLQLEDANRSREFQRQLKQDERSWQLQLKQIELQAAEASARLQQEEKKANLWKSAPEVLGRAIGQGIRDRQPSIEGNIASSPDLKRTRKYNLEANMGEEGETDCPQCKNKIFIAADAKTAVCANCNLRIPIKRIEAPVPEEEG